MRNVAISIWVLASTRESGGGRYGPVQARVSTATNVTVLCAWQRFALCETRAAALVITHADSIAVRGPGARRPLALHACQDRAHRALSRECRGLTCGGHELSCRPQIPLSAAASVVQAPHRACTLPPSSVCKRDQATQARVVSFVLCLSAPGRCTTLDCCVKSYLLLIISFAADQTRPDSAQFSWTRWSDISS